MPSHKTAPKGMVYVQGGLTQIGNWQGLPQEQPVFWVYVRPFFMVESPVTVAQFRAFVRASNYKTEAEKFGDGGVFDFKIKKWDLQKGANWEYPQGRDKTIAPEKAQRGGSYLCEPTWCHGYRVSGRSGSSPETALMHVGFRCVK